MTERPEPVLAELRRATEFALGYPKAVLDRAQAHAVLDYIETVERQARMLEAVRDDWYKRELHLKEERKLLKEQVKYLLRPRATA